MVRERMINGGNGDVIRWVQEKKTASKEAPKHQKKNPGSLENRERGPLMGGGKMSPSRE